mmetsp:Transcript_21904/g.52121  ORF Transcript_21904/g.52121 Transcript_21904/m.52121 type:complete len:80 (-) Transcript_21904:374-613(-)
MTPRNRYPCHCHQVNESNPERFEVFRIPGFAIVSSVSVVTKDTDEEHASIIASRESDEVLSGPQKEVLIDSQGNEVRKG